MNFRFFVLIYFCLRFFVNWTAPAVLCGKTYKPIGPQTVGCFILRMNDLFGQIVPNGLYLVRQVVLRIFIPRQCLNIFMSFLWGVDGKL